MNAKTIRCPFIRHEGNWYIIEGWPTKMKAGTALHLRLLNRRESRLVERYHENFTAELWAVIAAKDQSRTASTSR